MSLLELVEAVAARLEAAGVHFGQGTLDAFDEAAWLVLWRLGLPLDTDLEPADGTAAHGLDAHAVAGVHALVDERIARRVPAAYLTGEAWLQGVPFFADARAIVPRSLIGELISNGTLDAWLPEDVDAPRVLDLCTGGGSLAVLAARRWPHARLDASDLSGEALALALRNLQRHALEQRVRLLQGDGCSTLTERYDLVLCNPPYVNARSMAQLPVEFRAEPALALAGGADGMDFVRKLLPAIGSHLRPQAALVLEIGHERVHFEAAFARLEALWLATSAGEDQVCLITAAALARFLDGAP